MEYDKEKVDELTLALMYVVSSTDKFGTRSWKGFDWDTLDRLHQKGYIGQPKSKALSVAVTDEGVKLSAEFFRKHFGVQGDGSARKA
jgi:hypothetical protein